MLFDIVFEIILSDLVCLSMYTDVTDCIAIPGSFLVHQLLIWVVCCEF